MRASPLVVGIGKRAFYAQIEMDEHAVYEHTGDVMTMNALMADAHEGITAFLDKREPHWAGVVARKVQDGRLGDAMHAAEPRPLELGTIRLRWLNGGAFRMDGAAVFGQLPRRVWSTLLAPDDDNRVGLAARVLLVETGDELGLIDAGLPHTLTARQQAFLVVDRAGSVEADLTALGIGRADIRWVILTHLHPDHAGGMIEDGAALFPNARHVVQRREVETFQDLEYPWRHVLEPHDLEVLLATGLLEQVDGEAIVAPGVRVVRTGGHTPGHQAVIFEGQHETAICLGDLLPTRHHLDPVCVPAVDDFPLDSIATKRAELSRARQRGAWLTVAHDPEVLALRCGPDGNIAVEHR